MKTFKVYYDSKRVKDNYLLINAETAEDAENKFKDVYINDNGGNWENILKINKVEIFTKKYKIKFTGRKIGAIGKFYIFTATVEAPEDATKEQIILKLYDEYEHILNPKILNYE